MLFLAPMNINATAPTDYTIQIDYKYPLTHYADGTHVNSDVDKLYFDVTCTLVDDDEVQILKGEFKYFSSELDSDLLEHSVFVIFLWAQNNKIVL